MNNLDHIDHIDHIEFLQCLKCSKAFKTKKGFTYHVENNVCDKNTNDFKCIKCNKPFKSKQTMSYHVSNNICSTNKESQYDKVCKLCNREFFSKQSLRVHIESNVCTKKNKRKQSRNNESNDESSNMNIQNINNGIINTNTINLTCNYNGNPILKKSFTGIAKQLPFSEEIDSIMLGQYLGSIIHESLTKYNESIHHTIKSINCNPKYPMYNNIHTSLSLMRHDLCEVFDGISYNTIARSDGVEKLIKSHINLIDKYIEENSHLFESEKGKRDIAQYRTYVRTITERDYKGSKTKNKKDLEKSVLGMLIDIGKKIDTPEWLDELQKQYSEYYKKNLLMTEMLKNQSDIIKIAKTDIDGFSILLHNAVEDVSHPAIIYVLQCIDTGKQVEWNKVFEL